MKIAVHNPQFIFQDPSRNFNGYNLEFLKKYVDVIYLSKPWEVFRYIERLKSLEMNHKKFAFIFSVKDLNKKADLLMSFNGRADLKELAPPPGFRGKKIWHVMDYVFRAFKANRALVNGGVDHVMGYADHGRYCPFFQKLYPRYADEVITVPFGFGERFKCVTSFEERINKVIALGAVNPVNDPMCKKGQLDEYIDFYKNEVWTHKFRRILTENQKSLIGVMDSMLPLPPETKNPNYDPVEVLNKYSMYVNDEGLLNFPPARTYEGIACGCVMIASDDGIYGELGFKDGENYIAFKKNDLKDFRDKAELYLKDAEKMKMLRENGLKLAEAFTHERVAAGLYEKIKKVVR